MTQPCPILITAACPGRAVEGQGTSALWYFPTVSQIFQMFGSVGLAPTPLATAAERGQGRPDQGPEPFGEDKADDTLA